MSFHDRLADGAIRDDNTPGEFRGMAQKHANAFWAYAVLGPGVWYFFGLWWSFIPLGMALLAATQSISATRVAQILEQRSSDGP
ncbi:MAG: hypothetical protein EXR92_05880 [Gemmatimonadetes bacterium]|nr:hypothetical protein [Gemmatimonadota bacterium]